LSLKVFITGGTSGYGLALARHFQRQGHFVGVCGRDISKIDKELFFKAKADVTNLEELKSAVDLFEQTNGEVDLMIANAGIAYAHKTKIPDLAYSRKMIDVNVHGLLNTVDTVMDKMIKRGQGHLAVVSSVAGLNGLPGVSSYAGSKGFARLMFESLSIDLKSHGIDVSIIVPGFMDTPLTQVNPHPMPFIVTPEKAAQISYKALMKKKFYIYFPKRMYFLVRFLSYLPRTLFRWIFTISVFNFSKSDSK
jgi:short-subunit dehydrogenase